MIAISESTSPNLPSADDLCRAARWSGVESVPKLLYLETPELKEIKGDRAEYMAALSAVPGTIETWVREGVDEEVLRVAAWRHQVAEIHWTQNAFVRPPLDEASRWEGMSVAQRVILGEEQARALLFKAEEMRGRANRDPEVAARLDGYEGLPDPVLRDAMDAVDLAAGAVAADNALRARWLIETAPARARRDGFDPAAHKLLGPPTTRYEELMDAGVHSVLSTCSDEMKDHLSKLDRVSLAYLASTTAEPWSGKRFDPNVAFSHGHLERERDRALDRGLEAAFRHGASGNKFEFEFEFDLLLATQFQAEMQMIDAEIAQLPAAGGPDRLLGRDPVAAVIHDASQRVLLDRSIDLSGPGWEAGGEPGNDIGFDI